MFTSHKYDILELPASVKILVSVCSAYEAYVKPGKIKMHSNLDSYTFNLMLTLLLWLVLGCTDCSLLADHQFLKNL